MDASPGRGDLGVSRLKNPVAEGAIIASETLHARKSSNKYEKNTNKIKEILNKEMRQEMLRHMPMIEIMEAPIESSQLSQYQIPIIFDEINVEAEEFLPEQVIVLSPLK